MQYEKIFMGSYNLHLINTNKFKTITIDINFRSRIDDDITIRNLLKMVLLDSNNEYKTEREVVKQTENLYDLKLISSFSRYGTDTNISFKTRFLNEKYTEEGMNEESILFLLNTIFNPYVKDNSFDKQVVDKCKAKLKKSIISLKDNKLKYALLKLFQTTDKPYAKSTYGSVEELEKIDEKSLYTYYKNMLKNDIVDVFIVGEIDNSKIKEIFKNNFKVETFKKSNNSILIDELPRVKKEQRYTELDDVNQTQLTILCSLNDLTDYERRYVIRLYNEILGGSSSSMLFDNVREKNSLCYYINSDVKPYDNILFIYSGISNENVSKALKIIKKTLDEVRNGKISDEVIDNAKETLISGIVASMDNPNGIISTYFAHELVNSDLDKERIDKINKITKQEIINVSKKVNIYSILTLEKGQEDETN